MTLYEYLRTFAQAMPKWLERFESGNPFSRSDFFTSRIVFYPGSGYDGHPVKVFGSTHSAHCFVYADYGRTQADLITQLDDQEQGFRGYRTLARLQLHADQLIPEGWTPHVDSHNVRYRFAHVATAPFGFLEILEREIGFDDNHGPDRLAIMFLGADGIATYDALFCQPNSLGSPFAVVLQDHGFGGNYDRFGAGGLLEQIAQRCNVFPEWLFVAQNTPPWSGFARVSDVDGDIGGANADRRFLYRREAARHE